MKYPANRQATFAKRSNLAIAPSALGICLFGLVLAPACSGGAGPMQDGEASSGDATSGTETTATQTDTGTTGTTLTSEDDSSDTPEKCVEELPPAGASCGCTWTDCKGCALKCECGAICLQQPDACMLTFVDDVVQINTAELATWQVKCNDLSGGEFVPMSCTAVNTNCGEDDTTSQSSDESSSSEDSTSTQETSTTSDTTTQDACPIPVPGNLTLAGPVWGEFQVQFEVPFVDWAFAVAHAARIMENAQDSGHAARLSPSFFLATALKESYMGCSLELPPYDAFMPGRIVQREASYADGCFQIESITAWTELCRMFPEEFDCEHVGHLDVISSSNQSLSGRDNFASSALVKAYYDTLSYSMIFSNHKFSGVTQWIDTASDPQAATKLVAVLYNKGPWAPDIRKILDGCHNDLIENCMEFVKDYPMQIAQYAQALEHEVEMGNCYDEAVTVANVEDYARKIALLFRGVDADAVVAAANLAFEKTAGGASEVGFQAVAGAVMRAIDEVIAFRPHCPGPELELYYKAQCE